MPTMTRVVRHPKANLDDLLPPRRILGLAADLGLRFRTRALPPAATSYLFLRQSCTATPRVGELRHVASFDFSDSAYARPASACPSASSTARTRPSSAPVAPPPRTAPTPCDRGTASSP